MKTSFAKTVTGVVTAIVIVFGLTFAAVGCGVGKALEPFKDAPMSNITNDKAADKVLMPDGFSNVVTKCDHGNRVYVAYHGDKAYAALTVVPQDPTCPTG